MKRAIVLLVLLAGCKCWYPFCDDKAEPSKEPVKVESEKIATFDDEPTAEKGLA